MDTTTYVALSAQVALQKQLETVANNVANASTVGFKADRPFFQSYLARLQGPGGAVGVRGACRDLHRSRERSRRSDRQSARYRAGWRRLPVGLRSERNAIHARWTH